MPLAVAYRPIVLPPDAQAVAEPAARPFRATLSRRSRSLRARLARPRRVRSSAGASLAGLALASLAWGGATVTSGAARASVPPLQPFETAEENFPGSAFYYLDSGSGVIAPQARLAAAERPGPLDARLGDAVARPTFLAGSAVDRMRALHCLTTAIYYEAATEPDAGQRAVAQVVLNRVAHPQWPNSVCGVVFQGSEAPGCQFSFACDGSMARAPARIWWLRAQAVAARSLAGEVYAPVGLATYYHTGAVHPAWAPRQTFVGAIGAHLFYRPPGSAGVAGAFTDRYLGGEPVPGPRLRIAPVAPPVPPALALSALVPMHIAPAAPATAAPLPDALPVSGQIKPQYRNSGRWIAVPTGKEALPKPLVNRQKPSSPTQI